MFLVFFKQKTEYEMRFSDWSSDVCSSDLPFPITGETTPLLLPIGRQTRALTRAAVHSIVKQVFKDAADRIRARGIDFESKARRVEQASAHWQIGRASCRERVCQYV